MHNNDAKTNSEDLRMELSHRNRRNAVLQFSFQKRESDGNGSDPPIHGFAWRTMEMLRVRFNPAMSASTRWRGRSAAPHAGDEFGTRILCRESLARDRHAQELA